jgi:hypothetical protein
MQCGLESNAEIACARCHQRHSQSEMVFGSPLGGFRAYWFCRGCYARLARMNTFMGAGVVAIAIIIVCVVAFIHF